MLHLGRYSEKSTRIGQGDASSLKLRILKPLDLRIG